MLFMVVVLPFFLILLVIGIEVSQFLGLREEVQRVIDSEAKSSLGRSRNADHLPERIATRVESLKPYVSVGSIRAEQTLQQSRIVVKGSYQGLFTQLVRSITRSADVSIPFQLSTAVRRSHTTALLLLDRVVRSGGARCGDEGLKQRAHFIARLAEDLQAFGVRSIQVGVFPGIDGEVDILSAADALPRCGGANDTSPFRIASMEGVEATTSLDSLAVAYRAVQLLFASTAGSATEQRALIMVVPSLDTRTEAVMTTFSLLEGEAARQQSNVRAVGITVGESEAQELFHVQSATGRTKYLHLSEDEVAGSDVRVALVHHIQGHTVIAR